MDGWKLSGYITVKVDQRAISGEVVDRCGKWNTEVLIY